MRSSYDIGVKLTLGLEGKGEHTKDPDDPGGETYSGISRRYNPNWKGWVFIDKGDYASADKLVRDFYFNNYWVTAGCNDATFPMDICLFDSQVNPQNDPKWNFGGNKEILNMKPENWEDYNLLRMIRYKNNSKPKFVDGHIMRVIILSEQIKQLEKENEK